MPSLDTIITHLETLAPLDLAEDWDNVGLLIGTRTQNVERIMTCLTVTSASAAEAIAERADLIVTHHPVLFRPVQRLTDATPEGVMLLGLLRAGIAVFSPHTAFDNAVGGINDLLATKLGLTDIGPLRDCSEARFKIVVFVPESDLGKVSDAMFEAGAGHIGQYRECSFRSAGTGTFFGLDAANPAVGQKGRREQVAELRLEVVCPARRVDSVIAALRLAHSYEEPALDVYPLRHQSSASGAGRVGKLSVPCKLGDFAAQVKQTLGAAHVQVVGESSLPVQRIAIACGAGGEFVTDAVRVRADVLLTGEARFHDCLSAQAQGLALVLPGHYATERPGIEDLAVRLQKEWSDTRVWASVSEEDPVG